jgi:hypothetical protein
MMSAEIALKTVHHSWTNKNKLMSRTRGGKVDGIIDVFQEKR